MALYGTIKILINIDSLTQVITFQVIAPSCCLRRCWLVIRKILWTHLNKIFVNMLTINRISMPCWCIGCIFSEDQWLKNSCIFMSWVALPKNTKMTEGWNIKFLLNKAESISWERLNLYGCVLLCSRWDLRSILYITDMYNVSMDLL